MVVLDITRKHQGIRSNDASRVQTVVNKEGKRPPRDSCRRNTESKDILVLARDQHEAGSQVYSHFREVCW